MGNSLRIGKHIWHQEGNIPKQVILNAAIRIIFSIGSFALRTESENQEPPEALPGHRRFRLSSEHIAKMSWIFILSPTGEKYFILRSQGENGFQICSDIHVSLESLIYYLVRTVRICENDGEANEMFPTDFQILFDHSWDKDVEFNVSKFRFGYGVAAFLYRSEVQQRNSVSGIAFI